MSIRAVLLLAATLAVPTPLLAHTGPADKIGPGPNGGQMRDAGDGHLELVVKPGELALYVTDHAGKAVPTVGAQGSAILLSGKAKATVKLAPAGGNALRGSGRFAVELGMKAAVSLSLPGKTAIQVRFTPMEK